MDYTVYAIVGATGLFVVIIYIICAVSSGWNAKRCFEGSRATCCGRCLNSTVSQVGAKGVGVVPEDLQIREKVSLQK